MGFRQSQNGMIVSQTPLTPSFRLRPGQKERQAHLQKGRYIMKTVQTVLQQLTDPKTIMAELCETLRIMDPEFLETEAKYLASAANLEKELGNSITPSVSEFLAAQEEEFASAVVYIGWQGFQLNMDIFHAPINARMLRGDYGELHREGRLGSLPMVHKARQTIHAFYEGMRESYRNKMNLTEDITNFYSYLQSAGYKIVHYFGFCLADQFLPYVIPGYISDSVNADYYRGELERYLQMDIERLEK